MQQMDKQTDRKLVVKFGEDGRPSKGQNIQHYFGVKYLSIR